MRKEFNSRLNAMEERILVLKSKGSAVDQAASLIMTAREGHREPEWGMRLLNEAEEDIERSLSLAGDVEEIKADSLASVELSEEIAPIAKRPRKAWDMGQEKLNWVVCEKVRLCLGKPSKEQAKSSNGGRKRKKRLRSIFSTIFV